MKKYIILVVLALVSSGCFGFNTQNRINREITNDFKSKIHCRFISGIDNDSMSMSLLRCPAEFINNISTIARSSHDVMDKYNYTHLYDWISYNNKEIESRWKYSINDTDYIIVEKYDSSYNLLILCVIKR